MAPSKNWGITYNWIPIQQNKTEKDKCKIYGALEDINHIIAECKFYIKTCENKKVKKRKRKTYVKGCFYVASSSPIKIKIAKR